MSKTFSETSLKELASRPAINISLIFKHLGSLLIIEALFMLAPCLLSLAMHESDWLAFAAAIGITGGCGLILRYGLHPVNDSLRRRDGYLLTTCVWVAFSLFGMIPFLLCATPLNTSEGFFEAMSGFTTTGATAIRNVESCSHGILLWRALTQWLGGLGIIVFTIALIPSFNSNGGITLFNAESSGITHDRIGALIAETAKILWGLYGSLTLILIILLWIGPMNLFDSVCHAFATISTGGYSTHGDGIASYSSPYLKIVITIFMFAGGVNFALIYACYKGKFREAGHNDVFKAYLCFLLFYFIIIDSAIIFQGNFTGWQSVSIDPLFHIVSAMTSTGLGASDFESWGALVVVMTIIMMYIGACAGSTTGGAKIDRALYLIKSFRAEIKRMIRPRSVIHISINGQNVSEEKGHEIMAFILIFTALTVMGGVVLSAMGFPVGDSFFAAFSCAANNGLGAGMTGINGSYDFIPDAAKWLMSFLMLAGRLEVFTVIILFAPSFWHK